MSMQPPKAFRDACRNLPQGTLELVSTPSELAALMFGGSDKAATTEIQSFLTDLESRNLNDDDLLRMWLSTPADVIFYDGADVRKFLTYIEQAARDHFARFGGED